jgi:YidC/Oxa1 family membrane protein insertase
MKELQPKIKELQQKHAGNKEELGRAQMELFRKHNYNPLSGCLPLFLQLPIFIGLYTALSSSVDLRMAPFLWFENLASPDASSGCRSSSRFSAGPISTCFRSSRRP